MADENKTIIMDCVGGKLRKVTVPKAWKVTFGSVTIGAKAQGQPGYDGARGWCIRIYRAKDDQVLVYTDVISWREEAVAVMERTTKVKRQRVNSNGPRSNRDTVVEARITEWVDPMAGDDDEEADDLFANIGKAEGRLLEG